MKTAIISAAVALFSFVSVVEAATTTHKYPKGRTYNGSTGYIFVSATNGGGFCTQKHGSRSTFVDGEMFCGEDEDDFLEYDWYQKQFIWKSSGSKNQCYPIFREVTCSY